MDGVRALVLVLGAAGIALLMDSLPALSGRGLRRRLDPFLDGLGGRSSGLLVRTDAHRPRWIARALRGTGLLGRPGLRTRLEASGSAPDEVAFRIEQFVWAGVVFAAVIAIAVATDVLGPFEVSPPIVGAALISSAAAFLARDWWLSRTIARRQQMLKDQLPTAIDHMTLALMAGDSIPSAIERVAKAATGVVGEEFARVAGDVRSGMPVVDALDLFRARVPDGSIARFVDSLCTAIERGTSLSDVLRAQADDVRAAKRRDLLELGGRREILMLIPIVFLIMPVVVLFALYPGLVSLDLLVP